MIKKSYDLFRFAVKGTTYSEMLYFLVPAEVQEFFDNAVFSPNYELLFDFYGNYSAWQASIEKMVEIYDEVFVYNCTVGVYVSYSKEEKNV